jgi:hypothetical protein
VQRHPPGWALALPVHVLVHARSGGRASCRADAVPLICGRHRGLHGTREPVPGASNGIAIRPSGVRIITDTNYEKLLHGSERTTSPRIICLGVWPLPNSGLDQTRIWTHRAVFQWLFVRSIFLCLPLIYPRTFFKLF